MNGKKYKIYEEIVSCCWQCPHHHWYYDEDWVCEITSEQLENLEEFGKECPLKEEELNMGKTEYCEMRHCNETDNYYITFKNKNRRVFHTFVFSPSEFVEFKNSIDEMYFDTDLYAEQNVEKVEE